YEMIILSSCHSFFAFKIPSLLYNFVIHGSSFFNCRFASTCMQMMPYSPCSSLHRSYGFNFEHEASLCPICLSYLTNAPEAAFPHSVQAINHSKCNQAVTIDSCKSLISALLK